MYNKTTSDTVKLPIISVLGGKMRAIANIKGSDAHPNIRGIVRLYQTNNGVILYAEISGLPKVKMKCDSRIFGFHIHEGTSCSGNMNDPFANAMSHYNPDKCEHPYHAGDLPPLFGCEGNAVSLFLTDRFTIDEVIGKAIIIHDKPDDFTTQPSGNSGTKIACGIIRHSSNI